MDVFIAGGVFLVAYALIASERLDRTAGRAARRPAGRGPRGHRPGGGVRGHRLQRHLPAGRDDGAGRRAARTGFFEYVAGYAIRLSRGEPLRLLIILSIVTALLSAFLDNVTTVVLLTPGDAVDRPDG